MEHTANMSQSSTPENRPAGAGILLGKDGPQLIRSTGKRWSDEAEAKFLDHLAATCNVTAAAEACGFSGPAIYARRRNDPAFAERWQAALEAGHARIQMLLAQRAIEALEGFEPDPDVAVLRPKTFNEARQLLGHHRDSVEGGPRSRRQWARPRSLEEVRESILRKLEAIAPTSFETDPAGPPQDERNSCIPAHPEERGRTAERLEGPPAQ